MESLTFPFLSSHFSKSVWLRSRVKARVDLSSRALARLPPHPFVQVITRARALTTNRGVLKAWDNCLTQVICLHRLTALTIRQLEDQFPGLAAMVNFFEVAANCQSAFTAVGIPPPEVYQRVTDFVDHDTWRNCRMASIVLRSCCLREHRLNDRIAIVRGPFERRQNAHKSPKLSFDLQDMETKRVKQVAKVIPSHLREELESNFMPIIGSDRKAIMVDVSAQLKAVE